MKNIVLIGIMGCGKTTLSRMLGEKLNRPVIDIDEYIVEKYHQTIYIDRPIDNILTDVQVTSRPLLKEGPQKLYELDKQRHQLYLEACDHRIVNDDTLENITDKIIELITKNKFED